MSEDLGLRYVPYHQLDGQPNAVVDGSPTDGTVLTLTHWPGYPSPPGIEADLSAQMAFAYLVQATRRSALHGTAVAASNNHFDPDQLVVLVRSALAGLPPDWVPSRLTPSGSQP